MSEVRLILGDCLEVMKTLEAGSVDLVYADMMYDRLEFSWIDECKRLLSPIGSIYIQTDWRSVAQLKLYLDDRFTFQNWIVWCYKACPTRQKRFQRKHDDILFYTMSEFYIWNLPTQSPSELALARFTIAEDGEILNPTPTMKKRGSKHYIRDVVCRDWWDDIPVPSGFNPWDTGEKVHPWQKPIKLLHRIVETSSEPFNTVLDPFMGSGTTGVACIQTGRNFIGIEIDPTYFEIARRRIEQVQMQPNLFEVAV